MRHSLCRSTPTFRTTVSFVTTLKALSSFSCWDSAISKKLWIKVVPVCTYETATLLYVVRVEPNTHSRYSCTLPEWHSRPTNLSNTFGRFRLLVCSTQTYMMCSFLSPAFRSFYLCAQMQLKRTTRPTSEHQSSPVWRWPAGSVVLCCLLAPLSSVQLSCGLAHS